MRFRVGGRGRIDTGGERRGERGELRGLVSKDRRELGECAGA